MSLCCAILCDRGVIQVTGTQKEVFLQGLITNDIHKLSPHHAIWTGILTPQGKYAFDFFIYKSTDDVLLIDVQRDSIPDLLRQLKLYKLRSDVQLTDVSDDYTVGAIWCPHATYDYTQDCPIPQAYHDPRCPELGYRFMVRVEQIDEVLLQIAEIAHSDDYKYHRIHYGVAELAEDVPDKDIFWLETRAEEMNGVDFKKGCYVGQEVTARMKHKQALRRHIIPVTVMGSVSAPCVLKTDVWDVGTLIAVSGHYGLALVRIDRWKDAEVSMRSIMAGDMFLVRRTAPWERYED